MDEDSEIENVNPDQSTEKNDIEFPDESTTESSEQPPEQHIKSPGDGESESHRASKAEIQSQFDNRDSTSNLQSITGETRASATNLRNSSGELRNSSKDNVTDNVAPESDPDNPPSQSTEEIPGEKPSSNRNSAAQKSVIEFNTSEEMVTNTAEHEKEVISRDLPSYDFLYGKYTYNPMQSMLPEESEIALAKTFLMTNSQKSDMNLYDHLTAVVMRVLETRPQNAIDIFEIISADTKRNHFKSQKPQHPTTLRVSQEPSPSTEISKLHVMLFDRPIDETAAVEQALQSEGIGEIPDLMDLAVLWEWAGVTFGNDETFLLFLSIKKLVQEKPLRSVRVWGKILGLDANYIIVEGELKEGVVDDEEAITNGVTLEKQENESEALDKAEIPQGTDTDGNRITPEIPIPKPKSKPLPIFNKELKSGVNKYIYFVSRYPGDPWIRLPDAIPEKIQAARKIRKLFTGDLNKKIVSFPTFDGTEAQYLRCQIARISAATIVSPANYYMFDPDEGDSDENEPRTTILINPEFEATSNESMLSLSNWVHHVPYVLPQGRVIWEDAFAHVRKGKGDDNDEDDNEDDENEEKEDLGIPESEPEQGPPILSPLNGDEDHGDIPAWTARLCSFLSPLKYSPVVLRSQRWPGAVAVGYNDKFSNLYIGDGLKDLGNPAQNFVPPKLPEIQREYNLGVDNSAVTEEILEQLDPTIEEEAAFEAALKAKQEETNAAEEDADEGEPEEEDDE